MPNLCKGSDSILASAAAKRSMTRITVAPMSDETIRHEVRQTETRIRSTMDLLLEATTRGDGTDSLWTDGLAEEQQRLSRLKERQADLQRGPRIDIPALAEAVEVELTKAREGVLQGDAEGIREVLKRLIGRVTVDVTGRIEYETRPANLLDDSPVACSSGSGGRI